MSMNIPGTGLQHQSGVRLKEILINKKKNFSSLKAINNTNGHHDQSFHTTKSGSLNNKKTITYSKEALCTIGKQVQMDLQYKLMPFGVISRVRELRLNCKPIKIKRKHRTPFPSQSGFNCSNIIRINRQGYKQDGNIIFGTCNIQSVKYKELQVSELLNDYSMDFIVLTETWLNDNQSHWKDTTILNRDGWTLLTCNRQKRRGGGLALIVKSVYKPKLLQHKIFKTFKSATWELNIKNTKLTIHRLYHPPPSLTNKTTNVMFVDEFMEFAARTIPNHTNNLYIGNFNLHVSDGEDTDAAIFRDATEAMGLYQHVHFSTHKSGNTLDLILSDIVQSAMVLTVAPGPYITDHHTIISTLNIKRLKPMHGKV